MNNDGSAGPQEAAGAAVSRLPDGLVAVAAR